MSSTIIPGSTATAATEPPSIPTRPPRDHYHHGDLRTALVEAGTRMLEEVGLEKLSLRGIAARVGVSHTAPKNHFDGLRGLLSAIAAAGFRRHAAVMTEGVDGRTSPEERLRAACEGYVRFAREEPETFRLMFSPPRLDYADPALKEAAGASYAVLAEVASSVRWLPADGSEPNAGQTETMLWSFVHGYANLAVSGEFGAGCEAFPVMAVLPRFEVRGSGS